MTTELLKKPLLKISDIQILLDCGYRPARRYFEKAKEVEQQQGLDPFNLRPGKVSTKVLLEVAGLNPNFVLKQAQLGQKEKSCSTHTKQTSNSKPQSF